MTDIGHSRILIAFPETYVLRFAENMCLEIIM